jgi:hypothetical protein
MVRTSGAFVAHAHTDTVTLTCVCLRWCAFANICTFVVVQRGGAVVPHAHTDGCQVHIHGDQVAARAQRHTGTYMHVPVLLYTGTSVYVLVYVYLCTGTIEFFPLNDILVRLCVYWYVHACTGRPCSCL